MARSTPRRVVARRASAPRPPRLPGLLAVLCGWRCAAAEVVAECGEREAAAGRGLEAVHRAVVEVSDLCLGFQSDVYQRFSGYVVKHRVGLLCERVLAVFDGLRQLAVGVAPACAALAQQAVAAASATAAEMRQLSNEVEHVLLHLNANGDGSLRDVVKDHLHTLGSNLDHVESLGANAGARWPEVIASMLDAVHRLALATLEHLSEVVTYNVNALHVGDLPRFLSVLDGFPSTIPVDVRRGRVGADPDGVCDDVPTVYNAQHVYDPVADPEGWRSRDVSGILSPRPSVQKLMFALGKGVPLSYQLVAVVPRAQAGSHELTSEYKNMFAGTGGKSAPASAAMSAAGLSAEPACGGVGLAYSPAHCLFERGWGSMIFSLSTEPPFDGVLAVSEMSQKGASRPQPFVQPVANTSESLVDLIDLVDSVYKSLNTPSPDVMFLSPMVGNCLTLRRLGPSRRDRGGPTKAVSGPPQLTPKLVWVPINPLIPPPWEVAPDFTEWHKRWLARQQSHTGPRTGFQAEAQWWFAQCSLASAVSVLAEQGYYLLHVEHSFAVFILRGLRPALAPIVRAAGDDASLYDHWLRGWHCSPVAPTLFGLEWAASLASADLAALRQRRRAPKEQREALCKFLRSQDIPLVGGDAEAICSGATEDAPLPALQSWRSWELQDAAEERGKAYLLESAGRGRCLPARGLCECFPPYRGRFCEGTEPGLHDAARSYRAVLHYLVGERERLLADFERTLPLLWERFNGRFDYPVVVFHDGLSARSRRRIMEASRNRIWFAMVDDYTAVPAYLQGRLELDLGGYSIGYRGMCRFRSGPMFTQPVMAQFDYAWTLDTDGYFPASITQDPFERMHSGGYVYGFSHVSRDQASAVQHFWEFCRLYMESKGIDPKATKMMRRLTDALVLRDTYWHEWNRVLFMNDIEITKLSWFRGEQYQDFFRFLDSVGGFWLYRWGDHAVRTIAIASFLEPGALLRMGVPYGHQNTCVCGDEHPDEVCVRPSPAEWWECVPRSATAARELEGKEASGDVGTVHDSLLFGGT